MLHFKEIIRFKKWLHRFTNLSNFGNSEQNGMRTIFEVFVKKIVCDP